MNNVYAVKETDIMNEMFWTELYTSKSDNVGKLLH